ncbi:4-fold beta flower protein [Streptomyces sp. NPDC048581]|uniref:4-fold beta flower protein n=1 Tax=unclassified Streptomyces TaxID=2593676 RepID=UPI003710823A
MEPIRDRNGRVCAWLLSGVIYSLRGEAEAFLVSDRVVNYRGHDRGTLRDGYLRNSHGEPIAWVGGATGGPITPIPGLPPAPPDPRESPTLPVISVAPIAPIPSLIWSQEDWASFIEGR